MTQADPRWKTLSTRTVYESPWMRVTEDAVLTPGGARATYGVVHHPAPGCCIVPLDAEGCTWIVRQYRYALGRYTWEPPAGSMGADTDPLVAARRELSEETGLRAARWHPFMHVAPINAVTDLELTTFVAWELTAGAPHPDEGEEVEVRRLPFAEALEMVLDGAITTAIGAAAILQAHVLALRGRMPPEVAAFLRAGR